MTTIAKDVASKFAVAFVGAAMIFTMFATPAQAQEQTAEELQEIINSLIAQIAGLESSVGGGDSMMSSSSVCPYTWVRNLKNGSEGTDVMKLQQFLNSNPDTRVAVSGAGSAGAETTYYGPATAAAVSKFQVMHRADVLTPNGLVAATAYFGPSTRAKANMMCTSAPVDNGGDMGGDDMGGNSDDSSDNSSPVTLRGEADLEDFEVDDAADDEIQEGQTDVPIAELTVRFENGDAELDRIEFQILADGETNTDDVEPWDVFEDISIWVDGDMVASTPADDEDDWLDEDNGTIRLSGLGLVAEEDEDLDIIVAATIQNGLETTPAEIGQWNLGVEEIRFFDADGVSDDDDGTDEIGSVTISFDIQEEGDEDELFVRSSSNDPDSTTLELEDDESSDYITIFAFDLDTEDSESDIQIEGIVVDIDATSDGTAVLADINDIIDDAVLVVNGEHYDDVDINTNNLDFDLDDEDFYIDAGERVEVELRIEFEALSLEGATIEASVDSANVDAEGAEDLTGSQLSGSARGEEHTLRTEGAILEPGSFNESLKVNDDQDTTDDEGDFSLTFEVTAFESDLYVNPSAFRGTGATTAGVSYTIEDGSGAEIATGTAVDSLTSSAEEEGSGRFLVEEGETETFTLSVEFDPATEGFFQVQLWSLNFNVADADPNTVQRALDESDYETDSLSI